MCKIAIITGINNENRIKAIVYAKKIASEIASTQRDGIGYTAFDEKGNMVSEKWTIVNHAFKVRKVIEEKEVIVQPMGEDRLSKLDKFIDYSPMVYKQIPTWEKIGSGDFNKITSIMIHGRMATTGVKSLKNTHPFIHNSTALIHNGIIHNHTTFKKNVSECDSEAILTRYNELNVSMFPEQIQEALEPLSGYYACGVMSYDTLNNPIIDVFKKNASLYAAELACGLIVMSTSKDDILESSKHTRIKASRIFTVNDGLMLRINGLTGEVILKQEFKTTSYGYGYSTSTGSHTSYRSNYDNWNEYDPYDTKDVPNYKKSDLIDALDNNDDSQELDLLRTELGMDEIYWKEFIAEYRKDWGASWKEMLIADCEIELRNRKAG